MKARWRLLAGILAITCALGRAEAATLIGNAPWPEHVWGGAVIDATGNTVQAVSFTMPADGYVIEQVVLHMWAGLGAPPPNVAFYSSENGVLDRISAFMDGFTAWTGNDIDYSFHFNEPFLLMPNRTYWLGISSSANDPIHPLFWGTDYPGPIPSGAAAFGEYRPVITYVGNTQLHPYFVIVADIALPTDVRRCTWGALKAVYK